MSARPEVEVAAWDSPRPSAIARDATLCVSLRNDGEMVIALHVVPKANEQAGEIA